MKKRIFILLSIIVFISCKKDESTDIEPVQHNPINDTGGVLNVKFKNIVNNIPLTLSTCSYVSSANDTFTVDIFKYYISNIQLVSTTGYTYTESNSYYLINQADSNSLNLMIKNIPPGQYNSITFLIGVDSLKNVSGAQTGALDVVHQMFWDWNTGYIMAKMGGHSPQSIEPTHKLVFDIGGFSGKYKTIRKVNLSFPNNANITKTNSPKLTLDADLYKWFLQPGFTNFNTSSVITDICQESSDLADNYANMFSVVSVVN